MRALRTSNYEEFKDRNPGRLQGTCQWGFQHKNFQKWRESNSSSLIWISADPGCGKSVLSKSLIDEDFRSTETQTTCYFFFKDDNDIQDISTAISAFLHQLFSQKPILIQHAMSDYAVDGEKLP
jgi:ankyrin repeat domain-containing protein 50